MSTSNLKLQSFCVPRAARRHSVRRKLVLLVGAAALGVSSLGAAQTAPGEPVSIPGAEIPGWGQVGEVPGRFGRPAGSSTRVPAVLILHGSGGVDGRGAFYAKPLQEAGVATLEITMFSSGGRPRAGTHVTMPHAAAALKWLAAQPNVDRERLGVMGFSWGGVMSVMMASELVQERLGKDVPRPAAFAPLYPVCSVLILRLVDPQHPYFNAQARMRAAPMLIHVGTRDDYEEGERPCDALTARWPAAARERATVRYVEGATHGFDWQWSAVQFYDNVARAGRGGTVSIVPSPKDAAEVRQAVVRFFVKYLNP